MNISAAEKQKIVKSVEGWLRECVLGLSLCPYARVPFERDAVRIAVTAADDLTNTLDQEIEHLQDSAGSVETTLVVIAQGLRHFLDFNDCTGDIEQMLQRSGLDGEFQLAAFHPAYLFAGEAAEDASHYTNRAPYPVVQLLRVESVSRAVQQGDTLAVPQRNMETLRSLDRSRLQKLFPWVE